MQADFVKHGRMQQVRDAAHLLDGTVDEPAGFANRLRAFVRWLFVRLGHFEERSWRRSPVLAETIVQFARDAAALVVLRGNKAGGEAAQLAVEHFELLRAGQ